MLVRITVPRSHSGRDGTRHAVWFNQVDGQGRAFYGRLTQEGPNGVQALPAGATHADIAVTDHSVAVVWKRFDGSVTKIESLVSNDAGRTSRRVRRCRPRAIPISRAW